MYIIRLKGDRREGVETTGDWVFVYITRYLYVQHQLHLFFFETKQVMKKKKKARRRKVKQHLPSSLLPSLFSP